MHVKPEPSIDQHTEQRACNLVHFFEQYRVYAGKKSVLGTYIKDAKGCSFGVLRVVESHTIGFRFWFSLLRPDLQKTPGL